ncbi:MAG: serpin family protein [Methanogenium sp.]|jgi:serpin B
MNKRTFLIGIVACLVLACTFFAGCIASDDDPVPTPTQTPVVTPVVTPAPSESTDAVAKANTQFAYDLYQTLKGDKENANENIFFSPYSISTALALTYEGAKGKTADEIRSVFHFPENDAVRQNGYRDIISGLNTPDAAYSLKTANGLWAEKSYPFLPAYTKIAEQSYAAEVRNMDFISAPDASRQTINQWVEDQTEDRIKNLLPEGAITPLTRLVITNAVYFKGTWVLQFDENETCPDDFLSEGGTSVTADMMYRNDKDARYGYAETDDLQILRMPYEHESGKALSMLVLLPKDGKITTAESALGTKGLVDAVASMQTKQVEVFFPKFSLETTYSLPNTLKKMGMPTAFGENADFSGMDGTRNLSISSVSHKAFVDVNEEGTEAAAATSVEMGVTSMPVEIIVPIFRADHPFIFQITDDETGMLLFMGRIADPTA